MGVSRKLKLFRGVGFTFDEHFRPAQIGAPSNAELEASVSDAMRAFLPQPPRLWQPKLHTRIAMSSWRAIGSAQSQQDLHVRATFGSNRGVEDRFWSSSTRKLITNWAAQHLHPILLDW